MRSNYFTASVVLLCSGAVARLQAAHPLPDPVAAPKPTYGPLDGTLTMELGFTADRIEGRENLLVPLYRDPNGKNMLFLDGNWSGKGDGNENGSAGFGFRHRYDNPDIIVGVNAFYDYGDYSGRGYNQGGAGFELLSKWVDFRVNGYFPTHATRSLGHATTTHFDRSLSANSKTSTAVSTQTFDGGEGRSTLETTTTTTKTTGTHQVTRRVDRTFRQVEGATPGFDMELGGLVPYVDCWADVRLYAGYAYFHDRFGDDISCFTARLEARPVPAAVFEAQYKGDARLLDGENHWYFGVRMEIPFDLGNLVHGQSPFAGITEAFTYRKPCLETDQMRNRMNESIVRNWRPTVSHSGLDEVSHEVNVRRHDQSTTTTSTAVTDTAIQTAQ